MKKLIIFLWLLLGGFYYYLSQNHCNSSADKPRADGIVADTTSYINSDLTPNSYVVTEHMFNDSSDYTYIKDSLLSTLGPSDTLTIYGMDGGTARAQAFVEKIGLDDDRIKLADYPPSSIISEENEMSIQKRDSLNGNKGNLKNGSSAVKEDSAEEAKTDNGKLKMVCSCLRGNLNKVVLTISDSNRAQASKRARQYTDYLVLCGIPPNRIITVLKSKGITESSLETLIQK